jgi:integrase
MMHQDRQHHRKTRIAAASRAEAARASVAAAACQPVKLGRPRTAPDYRLRKERGKHGTWYFHHQDGKWRSLGIRGDEPEAVVKAAAEMAREADVRQAEAERDPLKIPLEEIFLEYAVTSEPGDRGRPHRHSDYKTILRDLQLIRAHFGPNATIGDISGKSCKDYMEKRRQQVGRHGKVISKVTAAQEIRKMAAAVNRYCTDNGIQARAITGRLPRSEARQDCLTEDEFTRILVAARRGWIWDPQGDGHRIRDYRDASGRERRGWVWVVGEGGWLREPYLDPATGETRLRNVVDASFSYFGETAAARGLNLQRAIAIGYYTGSRNGVIRNLGWVPDDELGWFDVERRRLHRSGRRSMPVETPGGKPLMTNKEGPSVLLPDPLLSLARVWRNADRRRRAQHVVKAFSEERSEIGSEKLATNGALQRQFARAAKRIGREGITIHTLRHTTVTQLALRGCGIDDAAVFVGVHVTTVRRHYCHLGVHGTAVGADFMSRRDSKAGKERPTLSPAEAFDRQHKAMARANEAPPLGRAP